MKADIPQKVYFGNEKYDTMEEAVEAHYRQLFKNIAVDLIDDSDKRLSEFPQMMMQRSEELRSMIHDLRQINFFERAPHLVLGKENSSLNEAGWRKFICMFNAICNNHENVLDRMMEFNADMAEARGPQPEDEDEDEPLPDRVLDI